MFGNIKKFLVKKAVERQLKNAPANQKDMIMKMVEQKPELFEKISKEIQANIKQGKGEMQASIEVMKKYQNELRDIMR